METIPVAAGSAITMLIDEPQRRQLQCSPIEAVRRPLGHRRELAGQLDEFHLGSFGARGTAGHRVGGHDYGGHHDGEESGIRARVSIAARSAIPLVEAARKAGQLAFSEGYVSPGPAAVVDRMWWDAAFLLGDKPTRCWLGPFASIVSATSESLTAGENIDVIDFPAFDPAYSATAVGGGDVAVALTDRPEVRTVMEAIASAEFGAEWAQASGTHIAVHRGFDLDNYENPTYRRIAELTREALAADGFRFDGSDLMPPAVGVGTFWSGMRRYFLEGPDSLEEIMAEIEASWVAAVEGS